MTSLGRLLRGSDRQFFDLFEQASANAVRAATLLDELLAGFPETQLLAREIVVCEKDGDRLTHELVKRINQSLVTPIDREDILRLSSALDDIVDYIEEVADYLTLYRIEAPMVQAQEMARVLLDATRQIDWAIPRMREFKSIGSYAIEVHRLETEGDRILRGAIAALFDGGIDPMVVIRWKDIFELLEDAIDAAERATFVLEGIVAKNA
jgi:uncharacterized protein